MSAHAASEARRVFIAKERRVRELRARRRNPKAFDSYMTQRLESALEGTRRVAAQQAAWSA